MPGFFTEGPPEKFTKVVMVNREGKVLVISRGCVAYYASKKLAEAAKAYDPRKLMEHDFSAVPAAVRQVILGEFSVAEPLLAGAVQLLNGGSGSVTRRSGGGVNQVANAGPGSTVNQAGRDLVVSQSKQKTWSANW